MIEFAPKFAVALIDLYSQNRRNSELFRGLLRIKINQRYGEVGMQKCQVIFYRTLNQEHLIGQSKFGFFFSQREAGDKYKLMRFDSSERVSTGMFEDWEKKEKDLKSFSNVIEIFKAE